MITLRKHNAPMEQSPEEESRRKMEMRRGRSAKMRLGLERICLLIASAAVGSGGLAQTANGIPLHDKLDRRSHTEEGNCLSWWLIMIT
jgi:hypothetical protein